MAVKPLFLSNSVNYSLPPPGYAYCPHCEVAFDLTKANGTFLERAPNGDTLMYVMCPNCHDAFKSGDNSVVKAMSDQCFINVKTKYFSKGKPMPRWAITSLFTINWNNGSLANAIERGHGLPRHLYDKLLAGEIQALDLVDVGINIVFGHMAGGNHD